MSNSDWSGVYARMCRVCLRHCAPDVPMTPLMQGADDSVRMTPHGRAVLALAKVTINRKDKLPHSICPKCLKLLRHSIYFKLTSERSHKILTKLKEYAHHEEIAVEYSMLAHYFQNSAYEEIDSHEYKKLPLKLEVVSTDVDKIPNLASVIEYVGNTECNVYSDNNEVYHDSYEEEIDVFNTEIDSYDILLNTMTKLVGKTQVDVTTGDSWLYKKIMSRYKKRLRNDETSKKKKNYKKKHTERVKVDGKQSQLEKRVKKVQELILSSNILKSSRREFSSEPRTKSTKYSDEELTCKVCDKKYSCKAALKLHSQKHFGFQYICEFCAKGMASKAQLEGHLMNTHGKEKKLQCDQCDFKGYRRFEMIEHKRKHTGERPFACETCGLTFRRRAIWIKHKTQHGEKQFKCSQCPRSFYRSNDLSVHLNNVHERRYVYSCQHAGCGATYAKSCTVRKHMAASHGVPRAQQGRIRRILLSNVTVTTQ